MGAGGCDLERQVLRFDLGLTQRDPDFSSHGVSSTLYFPPSTSVMKVCERGTSVSL